MKIFYQHRGTGKTTNLVHLSAQNNIPIGCATSVAVAYIKDVAKKYSLDIPEPFLISNISSVSIYKEIYIDNADTLLHKLFAETEIKAITLSQEE